MSKRDPTPPKVPLPRPQPSEAFLASGPTKNAVARRRIASAGKRIAAKHWPTYERVRAADPRIKPATLSRNSDALDEAREMWATKRGSDMVANGYFPTIEDLQQQAGKVRRKIIARFEHCLRDARLQWVKLYGPHPDWSDNGESSMRGEAAGEDETAPVLVADNATSTKIQALLDLAEKRIERLMAERKTDRATIAELKEQLAISEESLRRSTLKIRTTYAKQVNAPSTSTRV